MEDEKKVQVELVQASVIQLDPTKKYIVCFDRHAISKKDLLDLLGEMEKMGIDAAVGVMIDGDPATAVKVIEQ